MSRCWLSEEESEAYLMDWASVLLKTGMYEQAARIYGVLRDRESLLKALDRRQSSFNKITKSMGIQGIEKKCRSNSATILLIQNLNMKPTIKFTKFRPRPIFNSLIHSESNMFTSKTFAIDWLLQIKFHDNSGFR